MFIGFKNWSYRPHDDEQHRKLLSGIGKLSDFDHWQCRCKAEEQNARSYGVSGALVAFEVKGWNLHHLKPQTEVVVDKEIREEAKSNRFYAVINSADIDDQVAEKLRKSRSKKQEEVYCLEKFEIKEQLKIEEITEDNYYFWNRGKTKSKIKNFKILMMSEAEAKSEDAKEINLPVSLKTNYKIKRNFYKSLLNNTIAQHIENIIINKSILCVADCTEFLKPCVADNNALLAVFNITKVNPAYSIRSIKKMYESIGLSFDTTQKHNGQRTHTLNIESLERMYRAIGYQSAMLEAA
ncbi:hypothetical protein BJAS_P4357 [Bathymodiolus japonicus methanotrophic gill symbiont]|uniref:hypothetical protein n=1 Tax=Bathymodiolus japonicus methanotrophic gill symbiont TaxID=113269 RepID=UPI001B64598A|nr:hypothetical protein [Bathymodiolus japonicus methanotrophic gill symbiont]GFO73518.1 hypothetical protein BJAS_P4357 [Bathymodiolus japonicus methanotrophic gill symbiont]